MKKVLYYSPTIWGNTDFYRTTGVLPFINHPELILRDISHFGQINQFDLIGSDIIIIQRPSTRQHLDLILLAKKCGLKIISDFDDDLLNVDVFNPTFVQYQQQRNTVLQCIKNSNEVWCSTEAIQQSLGKGMVIPNALNTEIIGDCAEYNYLSNKVVWRGGSSHEGDMYENPDKIVKFVNDNPDLDFYFIGHRFTYLEMRCGDNFNSVEGMPIQQYFAYLKQLQPKALFFPLRDTQLNRAKSNIAFIEASWAGAAYFGNTLMPELCIGGALEIHHIEKNIWKNDTLNFAHRSSKKHIEENLTLKKVNELRIKSLLNL